MAKLDDLIVFTRIFWKRFQLSGLACLLLLLGCEAARAQFNYTVNSGTSVTITGYTGPGGAAMIPGTITTSGSATLPVTAIAANAFEGQTSITSVSVPSTVTSIGNSAFASCSNLAAAYLMGAAPTMGTGVFSGVASGFVVYIFNNAPGYPGSPGEWDGYPFGDLNYTSSNGQVTITQYTGLPTAVSLPASINTSGTINLPVATIAAAFENDSLLTSVIIPNSVTTIGSYAFNGCTSLTGITLPSSVTTIGYEAFAECTALAGFTIPGSVTAIGDSAFYNCSKITSITIPDSVTSLGAGAFEDCSALASVTLGAGITSIPADLFFACGRLTGITLSGSITSIGSQAFDLCSSITSIGIPAAVTSIASDAFSGCFGLTAINVAPSNTAYVSVNGVLFDAAMDTLIQFPAAMGGNYVIPATVTNFGDAFSGDGNLTGVTIPPGVATIADSAFANCTGLASISIGGDVTSIGQWAFEDCNSLTNVTIPDNVTSIADYAFYSCALKSITFGSGVTSIGESAFGGCGALTSIVVPANITSIAGNAFHGCSSLVAAYFMGNAPAMGPFVFSLCGPGFTSYSFNGASGFTQPTWSGYPSANLNYAATDGTAASITGYSGSGAVVVLPTTILSGSASLAVTAIGTGAFANSPGLASVTIPSTVTSIGADAFAGCASLTSVAIPANVACIQDDAFSGCPNLLYAFFAGNAPSMGASVFGGSSILFTVYDLNGSTGFTSPAWDGYPGAAISYSATGGASAAITGYSGPAAMIIPPVITTGSGALQVTSIAGNAFQNLGAITSVTIPGGVVSVGTSAFSGCSSLGAAYFMGAAPVMGASVFAGAASGFTVYSFNSATGFTTPAWDGYPAVSLTYVTAGGTAAGITAYSGSATELALPSMVISSSTEMPVTSIGSEAFVGKSGLTGVHIPDTVTSIGSEAFLLCTGITSYSVDPLNPAYSSVDGVLFDSSQATLIEYPGARTGSYSIPGGVATVDAYAFDDCTGLTGITIPPSVTSLGSYAFASCTGLTAVSVPGSIAAIPTYAFPGCTNLASLTIGNGVASIGDYAFDYCTSLPAVTIPGSVASIGNYAFYRCANLAKVTISNGVSTIETYAFAYCTSLSNLVLGNSVNAIDGYAFFDCAGLTGVTIPSSVTGVGNQAFSFCTEMATATFSGNAPSMGSNVFYGNPGNFTVDYYNGASGFSSPTWDGYASVDAGSAITSWLAANGYSTNAALGGEPNGDGVPLLMDYAFNLNPTQNQSAAMPRPVISGGNLNLTFYSGSVGVTYTVQRSADLQHWSSAGVTVSAPGANNYCTATTPATAGDCFMRIVVGN